MAKTILAWSESAGQFYREIGKRESGKPFRFYLGDDEKKAAAAVSRLEGLWDGIEKRWSDYGDAADSSFPCWDEQTLILGKAIAKGNWSVTLEPPVDYDPQVLAAWLGGFRSYFPMIQVEVADRDKLQEGVREYIAVGKRLEAKEQIRHREKMQQIKSLVKPHGGRVTTRETLHDALDAYKTWIEKRFVDVDGRTTQTGKKQGERAERIKRLAKDMPLSDFGIPEIDAVIEYWRTRPKKQDGTPYSFSLCKHTIRLFKHFLKWLHKETTLPWKKPVDLDFDRLDIVKDKEIKYKVETYSKEEIAVLWQHATHFERQLLLLALNCGFSISEIGSLDWKDIDGNHVQGLRPKTKVYGEFCLWEMTKQALGEPKKKGLVFVTKHGKSLIAPTAGNNTGRQIPNAWTRLLKRVRKFHPEFKKLGFHHLRKTAGDLIRKLSDGETMGVFLRHKKPVKTDPLAEVYSNPVFLRVFEAQQRAWEVLKDAFTPLEDVQVPRKVPPSTVRQIRELKKQGFKAEKLSEMFGVSPSMIRAYCRAK